MHVLCICWFVYTMSWSLSSSTTTKWTTTKMQNQTKCYILCRIAYPTYLVSIAHRSSIPIILKSMPTTILRLTPHIQTMHNKIIISIPRCLPSTNIPTHSNIQKNIHIPHRPHTFRNITLHNRSSINIPYHSTLITLLKPRKVVPHRPMLHVGNLGAKHAMLVRLMVLSPVETGVILHITVPRLRYVDFAVCGPGKGLLREKPECRPDAACAGWGEVGGEHALIPR